MNGKTTLWIDQYGQKYYSRTIKELRAQLGVKTSPSPMYVDGKDGNTYQVGIVIGGRWLSAYTPMREKRS